ncbi:xanthine dehydrogenase accessory protein XdhC [Uliginosibacterium sp. H1]|uniref:xanthine dehydrogenase accessory protein XdhC n=1 Tax=Uliginosibacterium sp. H1 TaxID=3114757 RepID=UPI002E17D44C|nr:xanthine dehydrogenase accessory protein XdhC [Uliginosibacterium sp. H1]
MNWLRTLLPRLRLQGTQVLVTVAHTEGSAPREEGAGMLVSLQDTADTIGGGHLEWEAIAHARDMLARRTDTDLHRFPLGARLGQCCGGVVWLAFERIEASAILGWQGCAARVSRGERVVRRLAHDRASEFSSGRDAGEHTDVSAGTLLQMGDDWQLSQPLQLQPFPVWLFGAGHVGKALAQLLPPLGAQLTWIDSRDDAFDTPPPPGVDHVVSEDPAREVDAAPPGSLFLVMTHSHAIDFDVVARILRRDDYAFCGLIGSQSKRVGFLRRLQARGLDTSRLTCPIGVAGITSKRPEAIAVAVAAQLLQIHGSPAAPSTAAPATTERNSC